ncbi:hypothetical protein [Mucilaginibacter sp.]|uniref:hypothetical protein n=1 Tax=Mucilaginibacter sp. TaxID=1882438 RepID=UPI0025F13B55|nr:hypothetical protein [Mucilaginibacter sp.]
MANIQFNYLYRDAGNYKIYASVIFANPGNISLTELSALIQSKLIDQIWFYAGDWRLPDLRSETFNDDIDPAWHEFENIEYIEEAANATINLPDFTGRIKNTNWIY